MHSLSEIINFIERHCKKRGQNNHLTTVLLNSQILNDLLKVNRQQRRSTDISSTRDDKSNL